MIDFKNVNFVKSCPSKESKPQGNLPEVLIVGKSNVGKSSLINALCSRNRLAFTSSKPGHTRLLNYYNIDNSFFLVDAPGYGYAKGGIDLDKLFGEMMESYFTDNKELKLVLILVDSRRDFNQNDLEIIDYVKQENIPYLLVITKTDKVNQSEKSQMLKRLSMSDIDKEVVYFTSSLQNRTLEPLRRAIESKIK